MKLNLYIKYIILYIFISITGFVCVSTICYKYEYNLLYSEQTKSMYKEAVSIAGTYASDYFSTDRLSDIEVQLNTISNLSNSRIMFIKPDGTVILDTKYSGRNSLKEEIPYTISNFDISNIGNDHSLSGNFFGIFDNNYISVFAPINNSFVIKGYVFIHIPESVISDKIYSTFNVNYITLAIMLALNLFFILFFKIQIHKPIIKIHNAINEYGKGNLSYKISITSNDEMGRLAASLNYMASKINEMDEYQQKFLSNISHDFRSPLTSIKGYLEAISDGTIPPEMQQKYIDIVLFETDRLTKLTSNILTLNELDPHTIMLDISDFDINSLIKHTIETFEGRCKQKKIQFNLTFCREKLYVHADKTKIGQVIYNLVDNAIKFSPSNSAIFIAIKEKNEKAIISIKDSGCGISKENINKIWDRFYKTDSSRGRDKKGSGLGLSIVKETVQAHNENIDVISTEGVGTEFVFSLPISKVSNANDEDAQSDS